MRVKVNKEMTKMILLEELQPTNCRDEEMSQVDSWEGDKDKQYKVRVMTHTKKCRLVDDAIQEDDNQTDEEYLQKQRDRDKIKRKKKEINPVGDLNDDFMSLANGIYEDDSEIEVLEASKDKEKKKNAVKGNPWRDKDTGQMTDKEHAGSFSLYFAGKGKKGKKGRAQVKGGKELFTKADDCGRADAKNTSKNTYKCSEPKKKYNE